MVYSATSCAKDEDLFSSKVVGVSYSSISPAPMCNQIRQQKHHGTKNEYQSSMKKDIIS